MQRGRTALIKRLTQSLHPALHVVKDLQITVTSRWYRRITKNIKSRAGPCEETRQALVDARQVAHDPGPHHSQWRVYSAVVGA
jgi:hypothetical protein